MERDHSQNPGEPRALPLYGPTREHRAPLSLLAALEERIEQYEHALSRSMTADELAHALHHEKWEVRCAALERLGAIQHHPALAALEHALSDDHYEVRVAALEALGHFGAQAPLSLLLAALNDPCWQVREMAVLSLARLPQVPLMHLVAAQHDANSQVREAVAPVLRQNLNVSQPAQHTREQRRRSTPMNNRLRKTFEAPEMSSVTLLPRKAGLWRSRRRIALLLSAAVMFLLTLTAAGAYAGWWNTAFGGNVQVYQSIGQKQTDQGVTITVNKVYADEGRTLIVYDITADPAVDFIIDNDTLTGSAPQKPSTLLGTSCSAPDQGVKHCYATLPAFLVPPGQQAVQLTWHIPHLLVVVRDPQTHVLANRNLVKAVDGAQTDLFLVGNWHFSFGVLFHHETRSDMPNPLN